MVEGLPGIKTSSGIYKGCIFDKHLEHKFDQGKASRAISILGLIHSDISRPMPKTSMSGSRYVLTFIDDFSRFTWVFFLKKKSKVLERFIEFKASVENAYGRKIMSLRYDNGGEYINSKMLKKCAKYGIKIQHSNPYTPQ